MSQGNFINHPVRLDRCRGVCALRGFPALDAAGIDALRNLFTDFAQDILGLEHESDNSGGDDDRTDGLMGVLCALRAEAKTNKDWATADLIRDRLADLGVTIKDGKDGTSWSFD